MHKLTCSVNNDSYPIFIGEELDIVRLISGISANYLSNKILLVCDENLDEEELAKKFQAYNVYTLSLPAGEICKNERAVHKIWNTLERYKFDRSGLIISFGGGVIGDLTGYAAATYKRGINWIQIPTTLIAQVDASIGGKTGYNFNNIKNMIGTFYQPKAVLIDVTLLNTLPNREYISGLAEIFKHAIVLDREFLTWCEDNILAFKKRDIEVLVKTIAWSCALKLHVVEMDPEDRGERQKLNFGHTFGHAIEAATEFKKYTHVLSQWVAEQQSSRWALAYLE